MNFCNLVYKDGKNVLHSYKFSKTIRFILERRKMEFEEKTISGQPIYILKKNIYDGPAKVLTLEEFAKLF